MDERWLHAAGLVALSGAATMLAAPDVPVGVLGGTERAMALLFLPLAWAGAGLVVAATAPPGHRAGASAVVLAMLAALPFYLQPDWAGPTYLAAILGSFVVTHLVLAPVAAHLTRARAAEVRRCAVVSGAVHGGLVLGILPVLVARGTPEYAVGVVLGAVFFGLAAWGLGTAASLLVARAEALAGEGEVRGEGVRRRARLLLGAAVVLLAVSALFPPRAPMVWAALLLVVGAVLAAGFWSWARPA